MRGGETGQVATVCRVSSKGMVMLILILIGLSQWGRLFVLLAARPCWRSSSVCIAEWKFLCFIPMWCAFAERGWSCIVSLEVVSQLSQVQSHRISVVSLRFLDEPRCLLRIASKHHVNVLSRLQRSCVTLICVSSLKQRTSNVDDCGLRSLSAIIGFFVIHGVSQKKKSTICPIG